VNKKALELALVKQLVAIRDMADAALATAGIAFDLEVDEGEEVDGDMPELPAVFGGRAGQQTLDEDEE
jgi:hypothetical protein